MAARKTVLVTGASGYLARYIVLELLRSGFAVRGSVRSQAKGGHVADTMKRELGNAFDPAALDFVELDLNRDDGWDEAMRGVDTLIHTASPFPLKMPDSAEALMRPAVGGTLRALNAEHAAGIHRVVLTSSVAAIVYTDPMPDRAVRTETDWSDTDAPACSAYARSKTMAERAAWGFVADHPKMELTVINPALIMGPPLDDDFAASMDFINRVMSGRDPMIPDLTFDLVDVRDVARMHVAAMEKPETVGMRIVASGGRATYKDIIDTMRAAFPGRRFPRFVAPNWFFRWIARFNRPLQAYVPLLGKDVTCSSMRARRVLGIDFTRPRESLVEAGRFMVENGHIR